MAGKDWMPSTIQGRIDMGRNWLNLLQERHAQWGVPASVLPDLTDAVERAVIP